MVNDDEMYPVFRRVGDLGGLAMVHAENGDVVAELTAKLLGRGQHRPRGHAYSRPPQVEGEATNRAIMIADMAGVPLYVVHTSVARRRMRRSAGRGSRASGSGASR
jgi:dihydropyrimidinase